MAAVNGKLIVTGGRTGPGAMAERVDVVIPPPGRKYPTADHRAALEPVDGNREIRQVRAFISARVEN